MTKEDKDRKDKEEADDGFIDEDLTKTVGPLKLEVVKSLGMEPLYIRKTIEKLTDLFDGDPANIISVTDQGGCPI